VAKESTTRQTSYLAKSMSRSFAVMINTGGPGGVQYSHERDRDIITTPTRSLGDFLNSVGGTGEGHILSFWQGNVNRGLECCFGIGCWCKALNEVSVAMFVRRETMAL